MASRVRRGSLLPRAATRVPMSPAQLDEFYRRVFLPLVRRATWRHRLSKEDALDIVQDAFVLALDRIDSSGNPRAWLIQVVDHLALNYQRKNMRRAQLAARWGIAPELEDGPDRAGAEEEL